MRARTLTLGLAAALLLALGAGAAVWRYEQTREQQASRAAAEALFAVDFDDADGRDQPMSQWKGKLLVVNFWATWCVPCVEEMPDLQRIQDEFAARNVAVVGVGIDDADKIRRFRTEHALRLPLLAAGFDALGLVRGLGDLDGVLPYTVLISTDGRVLRRHMGQVKPDQLRAWLNGQT
jgi:peroxiredoxin